MTDQSKKPLPFKPMFGQLLLEQLETPEKIGRIILPEKVRRPSNQGRIVAVGPDVPVMGLANGRQWTGFEIGCIVVFPMHMDHEFSVDQNSNKHHLVNYNDVLMSDFGYFASLQTEDEDAND